MSIPDRPTLPKSLEDGDTADMDSARRLFRLEAEGISALADSIDENFSAAVQALSGVAGRVIVSGMGKSGHIGSKIAATLASTGTPSHYVHPGEASHGDLGMITRQDAVLALSNSGETPELRDIAEYTRRFSIPLVVITSKAGSTLTELADVVLLLPAIPEACPMGLAPTTSTTMSLAMGDALAVAMLERKGFSAQDFRGSASRWKTRQQLIAGLRSYARGRRLAVGGHRHDHARDHPHDVGETIRLRRRDRR